MICSKWAETTALKHLLASSKTRAMLAKEPDEQAVEMYSTWTRSWAAWMPDGAFLENEGTNSLMAFK